MGWSRFKPVARTDLASGPALPAGAAPCPGPGAEMWEGWFLFRFFFLFFFPCFGDTRINNTIFDFVWWFLLLSGNVWVEGKRVGQVRVDEHGEDVGLGYDGDQVQTKVGFK